MAFIDSLIRKKKLAQVRDAYERESARAAREASAQQCTVAGREHADIAKYLWQLLEPNEALCVQRLAAANREESRRRERLAVVTAEHRSDCQRVTELDARLARLVKDLEKLEERRLAHWSLLRLEHQTRESQQLDEWVLGRHAIKERR